MQWGGPIGILALILVASVSSATVYAQTFYVATNKNIYHENERVVVAGKVSDTVDRRPVHVVIASNGEECAKQNVRPLRDGSFVSRPIMIDECGLGELSVLATHASMTASTLFAVEDRKEIGDSLELREIRTAVSDAQNAVNLRLREVLDANLVIPERAAAAYGRGAAETSLTLQAVDLGNVEIAMKHRESALRHFDEALHLLSPDTLSIVAEGALEEQSRVHAISEWFGRLQDMFGRLVDLADKNGVGVEQEFGKIDQILRDARQFINERKADSAEESLIAAGSLLEEARQKLIRQAEGDDSHALNLAANRLESWANELKSDAADVPRALAQINASFVHLNSAKSSMADGNYESAKASLDSTVKKLEQAKKILATRK